MKKYTMSFGAAIDHKPAHPERTARKPAYDPMSMDITFQVWPNRASMAKTIRMEQRGESWTRAWKAVVPLSEGEGF